MLMEDEHEPDLVDHLRALASQSVDPVIEPRYEPGWRQPNLGGVRCHGCSGDPSWPLVEGPDRSARRRSGDPGHGCCRHGIVARCRPARCPPTGGPDG